MGCGSHAFIIFSLGLSCAPNNVLFGQDNPDLFFFTGLVIRPKQRPCLSCLQPHRPSVKQVIISPLFVLMHGVEASPCHLHRLGKIIQIYFFHWACHTPQTTSVPVVFAITQAVCKAGDQFPTVRSDAWGGSIPLPSSLFGHDNPDPHVRLHREFSPVGSPDYWVGY